MRPLPYPASSGGGGIGPNPPIWPIDDPLPPLATPVETPSGAIDETVAVAPTPSARGPIESSIRPYVVGSVEAAGWASAVLATAAW